MKVSRKLFERRINDAIAHTYSMTVAKLLVQHQQARTAKTDNGCPVCKQVLEGKK